MLELSEELQVRTFRMEARYTATRLLALTETRHLAGDFEEAHDKFALLEEEGGRLDIRRVETQAMVEIADDAWDDTMLAFQRRLLELVDNDVDAELYRNYFADIPSHVTSLSYAAEVLISKDLEEKLAVEENAELSVFSERLRDKRGALEAGMHERTRLEVDEARFKNRVALAKAILNKLRRVLYAGLEEIARTRGLQHSWCLRFFHSQNSHLEAFDGDGIELSQPSSPNGGLLEEGPPPEDLDASKIA